MRDLDGKVALVTGAAGMKGMGRAIATRLARDGAHVVVVDHPKASQRFTAEAHQTGWKGLDSVVKEIQMTGRQGLAVNADLSSNSDVEELVSRALREFNGIDILVNNAAIPGPAGIPLTDLEESIWGRVLQVNLTGPFLLSKAVAKDMIRRDKGGKIIMISSIDGKRAHPGMGAYCASKAGLISLTQTLALELAKYKINVNAICPGHISTDMANLGIEPLVREKGLSREEAREQLLASTGLNIPLGRDGRVEEIASAVAFLASAESDYITGQALNVCGGALVVR